MVISEGQVSLKFKCPEMACKISQKVSKSKCFNRVDVRKASFSRRAYFGMARDSRDYTN